MRHTDIVIAAAIVIPASLGGAEGTEGGLKVVVVVKKKGVELDEKGVWEWCGMNIARVQMPGVGELVEENKKTSTGKIEKTGWNIEDELGFDERKV